MAKEWSRKFAGWPRYSLACRIAVEKLLRRGGSLSAYRSNPKFPVGPTKDSWAWRLERDTERMFGLNHVIAVNSGTMALQAALYALDLPKGGEVITTPYTFSATTAAIIWAGLRPVFADVHPETFCLDPASVKRVLTRRTVAILPVDLFGRLADYAALAEFDLPILEDACQAVGARRAGVWAGAFGDMAAFSFNGAKNVPAGEAGALVTSDEMLAAKARRFVSHGENWGNGEVGMNGRINEVTACVAWHGLREVLRNNRIRQRLCAELRAGLEPGLIPHLPDPFHIDRNNLHALYVCPLMLPYGTDRAAFIAKMKRLGVDVGAGYIVPPLHQYQAFKAYQRITLPVVEDLSNRRLCILSQVRPPATLADMRYLAEAIRKALKGGPITGRRRSLGYVKPSVF